MSNTTAQHPLRVLSLNVMADLRAHAGFERWPARCGICAQVLRQSGADIIALQECVLGQQDDVRAMLPGFEGISSDLSGAESALREDVRALIGIEMPQSGELLTLFRRDAFGLQDRREAWLSDTPDRVSIGFGARTPRSLLGLRLRHRESRRELWAVNARLDHRSSEPMADLAVRILADWIGAAPALWMGDFNAGLSSAAAQIIRNAGWQAPPTRPDAFRGERTEHIWRRGRGIELVACEVIDSASFTPALSDHDALLAQFGLSAALRA